MRGVGTVADGVASKVGRQVAAGWAAGEAACVDLGEAAAQGVAAEGSVVGRRQTRAGSRGRPRQGWPNSSHRRRSK